MRSVLALTVAAALTLGACASNRVPDDAPDPYRNSTYRDPPTAPPQPAPQPGPTQPPQPTQPQPTVSPFPAGAVLLEVRGMTCPIRCVREVKEQIARAPGVRSVSVDYDARTAIVKVEEGTDPASLARYVRPPYSAHLIEATR